MVLPPALCRHFPACTAYIVRISWLVASDVAIVWLLCTAVQVLQLVLPCWLPLLLYAFAPLCSWRCMLCLDAGVLLLQFDAAVCCRAGAAAGCLQCAGWRAGSAHRLQGNHSSHRYTAGAAAALHAWFVPARKQYADRCTACGMHSRSAPSALHI
jgi:hypothetical protein